MLPFATSAAAPRAALLLAAALTTHAVAGPSLVTSALSVAAPRLAPPAPFADQVHPPPVVYSWRARVGL